MGNSRGQLGAIGILTLRNQHDSDRLGRLVCNETDSPRTNPAAVFVLTALELDDACKPPDWQLVNSSYQTLAISRGRAGDGLQSRWLDFDAPSRPVGQVFAASLPPSSVRAFSQGTLGSDRALVTAASSSGSEASLSRGAASSPSATMSWSRLLIATIMIAAAAIRTAAPAQPIALSPLALCRPNRTKACAAPIGDSAT